MPGVTGTDWSDIRERLAALAAERNAADGGRRMVPPPLSPAELAEAEAQLGVELPEEYRSFLLKVNRGGWKPVPELWQVDGRWQWKGREHDNALDLLDQPFPHTDAWNLEDFIEPEPLREDFASQKEFDAALRDWWRRGVEIEDDPALTQGALFLDDRGCGFSTLLVVSGPARGSMWFDDRCVDGGLRPVLDDAGERVGFAHWYRRFLAQRYPVAGKTEDGERWSTSG
ncbi:SMI1/KNR4 family protein SUKH-1 [Micromonospora kangleipakensis]|uniref:SMI1/KNR4 family protein SUKH-1 n=1 Tax=Micromonospora kangleipakensis TaxID=1077942 RepID=A0A4Q8B7L6_9ACTN|nr:SMI1/KNR4 family protein SUKH-1 [Micromonospora kangleipakensis]